MLDPDDAFHERAVELYAQAPVRVCHNYVLAELIALANARRKSAQSTLKFVQRVLDRPEEVKLSWADEHLTAQGLVHLQGRPVAGYSLCDAVSFVVMRRHNVQSALTKDEHFEREGFQRLLS